MNVVFERTELRPRIGLVLGSGLGQFAASIANRTAIPYADIPDFPRSTAIGHKGELVIGEVSGVPVAVMSGRFHLYEGYSAHQATAGIRLLHEVGVKTVILTNAAGGINAEYKPGSLVLISDHINLQGTNPLLGPAPTFIDMTAAYSPALLHMAHEAGKTVGVRLYEGVYAGLLGPSYETPAEIRFLRTIGADLVGMSTVAETIQARYLGMEVLGISCVTNVAAGLSGKLLNHQEVLEVGRRTAADFQRVLTTLIPKLP